jgi:hypothetical protein
MVSVQEKIHRGIKANFIDSLLGILRLKKKSDEEVQPDTLSEQGFLNHDNFRHQTQANLRFKPI